MNNYLSRFLSNKINNILGFYLFLFFILGFAFVGKNSAKIPHHGIAKHVNTMCLTIEKVLLFNCGRGGLVGGDVLCVQRVRPCTHTGN